MNERGSPATGSGFDLIEITKDYTLEQRIEPDLRRDPATVLVERPWIGARDHVLSRTLLKSFFFVLVEKEAKPAYVILLSEGTTLACEDSTVLGPLTELERSGASVMVCGASLNHFKIRDKLRVGYVSNMYDIVEVLTKSRKVITL